MSQSHNDNEELPRVWLCDCGRVHVETNHFRLSFTPDDFLVFLRRVVRTKDVQLNVEDLAGETGSDANHPVPPAEVKALIERVERGLADLESDAVTRHMGLQQNYSVENCVISPGLGNILFTSPNASEAGKEQMAE